MSIIVGIDVGGSTTKIVGFRGTELLAPGLVKANDPIASIYGGFGRFTSDNGITLSDIDEVRITGVGSTYIGKDIYGIPAVHVNEFLADGLGGLYLSGLGEAVIVSMGTGTAFVYANRARGEYTYLGGTGVGGGTLNGLADRMLGIRSIQHVASLAEEGDLFNVDLRISDITESDIIPTLSGNATASNFGNVSDMATKSDLALGIINMVAETIAMMAVFIVRDREDKSVVLTGTLMTQELLRSTFMNLCSVLDVNFIIPENADYATAVGASLAYRLGWDYTEI